MPAVNPSHVGPDAFTRGPRVLQCLSCRRTEPRPADSLRRLAQGRWPECCGRVMVPAFEEPAEPIRDDSPWADRRLADRRPPRPGTRVVVRRGALGRGPDVAVKLLDVSGGGAKVRVRAKVRPGDPVFVTLIPPGGAWMAGGPATVCWSTSEAKGTVLAGVRFRYPLTERQVIELTN